MYRNKTKVVKIGNKVIGGGNPILIQSMTNTKTDDVTGTVEQINRLTKAGATLFAVRFPHSEAGSIEGYKTANKHTIGGRYSFRL